LYKHAPTEDAAAVLGRSLPEVGLDPAVLTSGQVQLADTTALRAQTGGRHERLYGLHLEQLRQAIREGFAGLALTGDAAAMHTITRTDAELAGYERDLERLAIEAGVRSLCRYPRRNDRGCSTRCWWCTAATSTTTGGAPSWSTGACGCTGRSTSPPLTGSPRCCGRR
jgi:hypothetical protein